jgi:hypothetical protein
MYKTIFTIDGIVPAYIGYTSGRLWNGWATPFFEVTEAFAVMKDFNKSYEGTEHLMEYDAERDEFFVYDEGFEDFERWKGANYNTDEGIKHLYGIGAYCLVWDAVNDCDRRYLAQQVEEFICYHKHLDEYGIARDKTVESIIKQFKNLDTFHKAICIMRNEELEADERFKKLGGILKL